MSFSSLKKNRNDVFEKLSKQLDDVSAGRRKFGGDDRYWKPKLDKAGNAFAIIRFLPSLENEDPYIEMWGYGFKGATTNKWYIEKSLTSIKQEDPVNNLNRKLKASDHKRDIEQAQAQKMRLKFVSNVYIINDGNNPENNGKVFLYEYGKKIFDKINDLMNPEFDEDKPINPFDMWSGANFRLSVRKDGQFPNYDKSRFEDAAALKDNDDELEAIYNSQHSLKELLDPKNFGTYAELEAKLRAVLGSSAPADDADVEPETQSRFDLGSKTKEEPEIKSKTEDEKETPNSSGDDDDDDIEYFKKLGAKY